MKDDARLAIIGGEDAMLDYSLIEANAGKLAAENRLADLKSRVVAMSARIAELEAAESAEARSRDATVTDEQHAGLLAELEGTRRQAAQNAAAAARAQIEADGLKQRVDELEARRGDMVARITQLEDIERVAQAREGELCAALDERTALVEELEARRGDMVARISQLEEAGDTAQREKGELRSALSDRAAELERTQAKLDSARAQLERRAIHVAKIQSALGEVATAQEATRLQLETAHAMLERRSAVIHKLELARSILQAQLDEACAVLEQRARNIANLQANEALTRLLFLSARSSLAQRNASLADLKSNAAVMYARITELEAARTSVQSRLDETQAELHEAQSALYRANDEFAIRQRDADRAVADLRKTLDFARAELNDSRERTESQSAQIATLESQTAELPALRVRAFKSEKHAEFLETQVSQLAQQTRRLEDYLARSTEAHRALEEQLSRVSEQASASDEQATRLGRGSVKHS